MLLAPIPANESKRLASLRAMHLVNSPDEAAFDSVTRIAKAFFKVPVVLISVVDQDKQWFKSCIGLPVRETSRDISFCGHAIMAASIFVVEDATNDRRFHDNPLVTAEEGIRFYAGRPLFNHENMPIGTLCLIDSEPRSFSEEDKQVLDDFGRLAELALLSRQLSEVQSSFLQAYDEATRYDMLDARLNIWKRSHVLDLLQREILRAYHQHAPLGVLRIDLCEYQAYRAQLGEAEMAKLMTEFCQALTSSIRAYDTLGLFDEGKFIIALPNADELRGYEMMAKIQRAAGMLMYMNKGEIYDINVAQGFAWADYVTVTPDVDQLIENAEQNLLKRQVEVTPRNSAEMQFF